MRKYKNVRVLGITGGVGAGKSTVLSYLEKRYGARVILCDDVARMLQEPGKACYEPMKELLGEDVLRMDGGFNRKLVAERVFADEEMLKRLNGIVHPAVKKYVTDEINKADQAGAVSLMVVEAALLLEDHYDLICDEIWYIYTAPEARIRRLQESRGYSGERIRHMMKNQKSDGFFREHCQFVVDNSSDNVENTYEQIDKGLKEHGFL